jgi:hypothetical protein
MSDNRYNYNYQYTPWGPMWPFVAPWVQAMQAWTCAMAAFGSGMPQRQWDPCAPCDAPGRSPRVSVKVSSPYRTEVSACIDPGAEDCHLTAELKTSDTSVPPLSGISIKKESGHVCVSVTVPTGQPPGRYSGAIRDAAGCRRGELTVEMST